MLNWFKSWVVQNEQVPVLSTEPCRSPELNGDGYFPGSSSLPGSPRKNSNVFSQAATAAVSGSSRDVVEDVEMGESTHEYIDLISSDEDETIPPAELRRKAAENPSGPQASQKAVPEVIDLTLDDEHIERVLTRIKNRRGTVFHFGNSREIENALAQANPRKILKERKWFRRQKRVLRQNSKKEKHKNILYSPLQDAYSYCSECKQKFAFSNPPLSMYKEKGLCTGCYNLLKISKKADINDVKHWLLTGELSMETWSHEVDNSREESRVKNRASDMRSRMRNNARKIKDVQSMPSQEALYDLCVSTQFKCAVTGWTCHFPRDGRNRYWSATFDHIVPISIAPPNMNPWTIENIQVMCHLLNSIKGNFPDDELRRWFHVWKENQK